MKKNPKYSVGCEVTYRNEDGSECRGSVYRISQVGKCYVYTVNCGKDSQQTLFEDRIIESDKLKE